MIISQSSTASYALLRGDCLNVLTLLHSFQLERMRFCLEL